MSLPDAVRQSRPPIQIVGPRSLTELEAADPLFAFRAEATVDSPSPAPVAGHGMPDQSEPSRTYRSVLLVMLSLLGIAAGAVAVMLVPTAWSGPVPASALPMPASPVQTETGTASLAPYPGPIDISQSAVLPLAESAPLPLPVTAPGRLHVTSDPPGARVSIDGGPSGVTPLIAGDLNPGEHVVAITGEGTTVRYTVNVASGGTAAVLAVLTPVGMSAGWLAIDVPLDMHVLEDGLVVGMTSADRVMLPAGRHELELVSATFEFRTRLSVDVPPGGTTTARVAVPNGSLSVNALPWAEVSIDGQPVGTTPLANLSLPIGSHEIVWRHPEFGERRRTVAVPAQSPARVGMDFRQ